jgi:hypothetical protein
MSTPQTTETQKEVEPVEAAEKLTPEPVEEEKQESPKSTPPPNKSIKPAQQQKKSTEMPDYSSAISIGVSSSVPPAASLPMTSTYQMAQSSINPQLSAASYYPQQAPPAAYQYVQPAYSNFAPTYAPPPVVASSIYQAPVANPVSLPQFVAQSAPTVGQQQSTLTEEEQMALLEEFDMEAV